MKVQGIKYRFTQGIILTGVKLYKHRKKTSSSILLQTENLIIDISLINLFQGSNPFTIIHITNGKFHPMALNTREWESLFSRISMRQESQHSSNQKEKNEAVRTIENSMPTNQLITEISVHHKIPENISIQAENLRIILPVSYLGSVQDKNSAGHIFMDISIEPSRGRSDINFYVKSKQESSPQLKISSKFNKQNNLRLDFKFNNITTDLAGALLGESPLLTGELKVLYRHLLISSGIINGKGSMDSLLSGLGINIFGNYDKLTFSLGKDGPFELHLNNGRGEFKYNVAYKKFFKGPIHASLQINQENFKIKMNYKKIKTKQLNNHFLAFSGSLQLDRKSTNKNNINKIHFYGPAMETSGTIEFLCRYDYGRKWIYPHLDLRTRNFFIYPTGKLFKFKNENSKTKQNDSSKARLEIKNANIQQKGNEQLNLNASGTFGGAQFNISGKSLSKFKFISNEKESLFIIKQDIKAIVRFDGLQYKLLIIPLSRIHNLIITSGTSRNAERAVDQGLLSRYKFLDPYYRQAFIENTKMKIKFLFANMKQIGDALPENLELTLFKKNDFLYLKLKEISTEKSKVAFQYTLTMDRPLPFHKIKFIASIKNNQNPFPEILGNPTPPRDILLEYHLDGQGWLPHDIINHTFSKFKLELHGVDLSNFQAAQIIKHRLKLKNDAFLAETFILNRVTEGSSFRYHRIHFASQKLTINGYGQFLPGRGGSIDLRYNTADQSEGKIKLLISRDNIWAPETGL